MIIRKPYAFLIKNFRKIHIFLFIACAFIYYKMLQVNSFVREFMNLGSYDAYNEPISKYISGFSIIFLIMIIAASLSLVILLKHKNKPWKLYLSFIIIYSAILFVFMWTSNFFNSYNGSLETTNIRMIRDLLFISSLFQYPVFIILLIRIFGVDLHKFNFNKDQEYLELDSEDRDEVEISIDIDKESFKRLYRKFLRNLNYFYLEHKFICNSIIAILLIILIRKSYVYIFITNKSYQENEILNANGYSITINDSYYTNRKFNGDIISAKQSFIIINLTIKNNIKERELDLNNFHVLNGVENYKQTQKTYETEFKDLGVSTDSVQKIKRDESKNVILIYRVDSKLPKNRFVLYYQELGNNPFLRKIKLSIQDISKIKENEELNLGDNLEFEILGQKENIVLEKYSFVDNINYLYQKCLSSSCTSVRETCTAKEGEKILYISFSSDTFEGKEMIDFSSSYGKIIYKNSIGEEEALEVKNGVSKNYMGKYLYLRVPKEVETATDIKFVFTVRNNRYIYNLVKGE